jgi:fumarate hydratase class II
MVIMALDPHIGYDECAQSSLTAYRDDLGEDQHAGAR